MCSPWAASFTQRSEPKRRERPNGRKSDCMVYDCTVWSIVWSIYSVQVCCASAQCFVGTNAAVLRDATRHVGTFMQFIHVLGRAMSGVPSVTYEDIYHCNSVFNSVSMSGTGPAAGSTIQDAPERSSQGSYWYLFAPQYRYTWYHGTCPWTNVSTVGQRR